MKKLVYVVIAAIICGGFGILIYKNNKANAEIQYWYQKYTEEEISHTKDLKNIGTIVYDSYRNGTVHDHGWSLWFIDEEYCSSDKLCAVYVEPNTTHVIK